MVVALMNNALSFTAAPGEPFIQVTGIGLWSPPEIERHFRELDRALRSVRARRGFARLLIDMSEAKVQTVESAAALDRWTGLTYRERDEVAVICTSTLLAMQTRRTAKIYHRAVFTEKNSAVAWLLSDKSTAASRPTRSA
jgi:hypothetical protein